MIKGKLLKNNGKWNRKRYKKDLLIISIKGVKWVVNIINSEDRIKTFSRNSSLEISLKEIKMNGNSNKMIVIYWKIQQSYSN